MKQSKNGVVLVAAGKGQRMGLDIPKQFIVIGNQEILAHTVAKWELHKSIAEIVLVVGLEDISFVEELRQKYQWSKVTAIVAGGKERGDSVCAGISALSKDIDVVLIHDGVRPFVTANMIDTSIEKALEMGACVVGVPAKDTIKRCNTDGLVLETPKREELWQIQTPQTFQRDLITKAYALAQKSGFAGTDDASIAEFAGYPVCVTMGSYGNIKITTEEDLFLANCFLKEEKP
ncbi:2-C-methyl-D-erythritol 4-phosphate cytidylyltransferase [Chakrabartyella piscis]|uniref:2-C-methyl-D-erythritol 4-phosphate cytidylyltransferase n=1 Tax=Chakrabartyella piscis TaxID=2918914 RepID=UPI0029586592|nr:2-C-methyl-D-erythritol 4-phosphate cytidylyltransferase [Chakrabartyella piscis]